MKLLAYACVLLRILEINNCLAFESSRDVESILENTIELKSKSSVIENEVKGIKTALETKLNSIESKLSSILDAVDELAEGRDPGTACPDNWISYGGSCYLFSSNTMNFVDAEEFCEEWGGHLVHVDDYSENNFIKSHLADIRAEDTWIGLTDMVSEGVWKWYGSDKQPNFTDWNAGEPNNNGNEDCTYYRADENYKWNDKPCSSAFRFVCEM